MWAGFAAYLGALALAPRLDRRLVWAAIAALIILFACLPPLLSHDVYSYVDYARLAVQHGLDPYVHAPRSAPGDPAFPHVTWTETSSAYGPLFTLATYPLAWLPVEAAVYVLKAASAAAVMAIAYLLARLAPARGIDPTRAAAFVALNPLVLVHVVGGPHNDGFAVLLMTLGLAGMLTAREGLAGGAFVAAGAAKATAAIAIPFALLGAERRRRFLLGGLVALALVALAAYLAFGWNWLHAFTLAGENQGRTSHLSIPITTARLTGLDPDWARAAFLVLYAALVIYLLAWTHRGGDWLRATAWATTGLLLATAWLLPWYLLWPLPAVALSRDRVLQALLLGLTAYQLGARIPL
ncbi:MAG TPA: polyprenol phosphomannose-dependent alpha 1,6 mannosyltransferase MptB [Solirubrobacterales bacterium]|jgi:alpha-1,6-mannosyltransferase|nr:polyprenol phosphomannose-dependent alpha 1,6 mannosyltransferase MptB [Solirubrobacterales bacterium]